METSLRCRIVRAAVVLVATLLGAARLEAAVHYVSPAGNDGNSGLTWAAAKKTVQAGLNAAAAGDQVWVAAGTYVERITLKAEVGLYGGFAGGETELAQRNWVSNRAILDGEQAGPMGSVVTAPAGAAASTRIDGFTIRNGNGTVLGSNPLGGGIYCAAASPTITNNTITGNGAGEGGGGIYCRDSSATITHNTISDNVGSFGAGIYCSFSAPRIENNTIAGNLANQGGGIFCNYSSCPKIMNNAIRENMAYYGAGISCFGSSPIIANNTIAGNSCLDYTSGYGGGIDCNQSSPIIVNNTISGNAAVTWGGAGVGGGISCYASSPTIANNTIAGNRAGLAGGGIHCSGSSSPAITNNTITGNTVVSDSRGGGIYFYSSSPRIFNTVIAFNSSGIYKSGGTPQMRYNCVYGNTAYNYAGLTDPTGTNGNRSADPRFVRPASAGADGTWGTADDDYGDLRLLPGSAGIDAGNNGNVATDGADLDGDGDTAELLPVDLAGGDRFVDDPATADAGAGTPPLVDMGAHEYLCGDVTGDSNVDVVDLLTLADSWGKSLGEVGFDPASDLNGDDSVDVIDLLHLAGNWGR